MPFASSQSALCTTSPNRWAFIQQLRYFQAPHRLLQVEKTLILHGMVEKGQVFEGLAVIPKKQKYDQAYWVRFEADFSSGEKN